MHRIVEKGNVSLDKAFHDYFQGIFSYGGRSTRAGYWWGQIACLLCGVGLYTVFYGCLESAMASGYSLIYIIGNLLVSIASVFLYIAEYAVLARRLRDLGFKTIPVVIWLCFKLVLLFSVKFLGGLLFGIIYFAAIVTQAIMCCLGSNYFIQEGSSKVTHSIDDD